MHHITPAIVFVSSSKDIIIKNNNKNNNNDNRISFESTPMCKVREEMFAHEQHLLNEVFRPVIAVAPL